MCRTQALFWSLTGQDTSYQHGQDNTSYQQGNNSPCITYSSFYSGRSEAVALQPLARCQLLLCSAQISGSIFPACEYTDVSLTALSCGLRAGGTACGAAHTGHQCCLLSPLPVTGWCMSAPTSAAVCGSHLRKLQRSLACRFWPESMRSELLHLFPLLPTCKFK